jgi:hypothetical protein
MCRYRTPPKMLVVSPLKNVDLVRFLGCAYERFLNRIELEASFAFRAITSLGDCGGAARVERPGLVAFLAPDNGVDASSLQQGIGLAATIAAVPTALLLRPVKRSIDRYSGMLARSWICHGRRPRCLEGLIVACLRCFIGLSDR